MVLKTTRVQALGSSNLPSSAQFDTIQMSCYSLRECSLIPKEFNQWRCYVKRTRKEYGANGHKFVVLGFDRESGDPTLNDKDVDSARTEEGLRPITRDEFSHFRSLIATNPTKRIVAFGNTARGSSEAGFAGVPFLDTDGEVKVEENWTRGNAGDLWNGNWEFVFAPAS